MLYLWCFSFLTPTALIEKIDKKHEIMARAEAIRAFFAIFIKSQRAEAILAFSLIFRDFSRFCGLGIEKIEKKS